MTTLGESGSDDVSGSVELQHRITSLEKHHKATRSVAIIALALSLFIVAPGLSIVWIALAAFSALALLEPWLKRTTSFLPANEVEPKESKKEHLSSS